MSDKLLHRIYSLEMQLRKLSAQTDEAHENLKKAKADKENAEIALHEAIMEYKNPKLDLKS